MPAKHRLEAATKPALAFINRAAKCMAKNFKSAGLGDDYRFQGDHIAENALMCDGSVIHAAFFNLRQEEKKR